MLKTHSQKVTITAESIYQSLFNHLENPISHTFKQMLVLKSHSFPSNLFYYSVNWFRFKGFTKPWIVPVVIVIELKYFSKYFSSTISEHMWFIIWYYSHESIHLSKAWKSYYSVGGWPVIPKTNSPVVQSYCWPKVPMRFSIFQDREACDTSN